VIDPHAYAAWDPLLDKFDWLRTNMPVTRIEHRTIRTIRSGCSPASTTR
jgi:hypothetical protein